MSRTAKHSSKPTPTGSAPSRRWGWTRRCSSAWAGSAPSSGVLRSSTSGPGHPAKLIELIEGRTAAAVSAWLDAQPAQWRAAIRWGVLDMSGPYRKTFDDSLPDAVQVADPFHVVRHANSKLDECRRRVQNETLGHRGRKADPLYRSRRLLTSGHERLASNGETRLLSLLEAGDPHGEVRMTWHAKETVRRLYDIDDPDVAAAYLDELVGDMAEPAMPPEVRSLAGTLRRWRAQILAWHRAKVSNGPTEAFNNLIKRIKRVGFGSAASATTGSAPCSTPADRTGTYSPPSHPAEIRRAAMAATRRLARAPKVG